MRERHEYLQPGQMQQRVERFWRFQMMIVSSYSVSVKKKVHYF